MLAEPSLATATAEVGGLDEGVETAVGVVIGGGVRAPEAENVRVGTNQVLRG